MNLIGRMEVTMKKHFKKLMLILVIMLIFLVPACNKTEKIPVQAEVVEEIKEEGSASHFDKDLPIDPSPDSEEKISPEMDGFLKILTPETTTARLKAYMEENIQYVSKEEAEEMLEFLLIYQTETIADFLITEGFFDQVYEDMDESAIESNLDEKIKADYKLLSDSSLTTNFSENHLYIDRDWESLKKFSPYLPQVYDEVFNLYIQLGNYEYDGELVDVTALGQEIIKTESLVRKHNSIFFKKIANELYEGQLYDLLLGPEGSHVYLWEDKNGKEYGQLMELSEEYPESKFSQIINEMDQIGTEEISDASHIIKKYLAFGLESENYIETVSYSEGQGDYEIIQVKIPGNEEKEKKINNIIKTAINKDIEDQNIKEYFYVSIDLKHADDRYISYDALVEYTDSQGNEDYKNFYRTLDYQQEKHITLEEYLGTSFDEVKQDLEEIVGEKIDTCPEFILFANDISLYSDDEKSGIGYIGYLNLKDLMFLKH